MEAKDMSAGEVLLPVADEIRRGRPVSDQTFDGVYPEHIRRISARFWTPVAVARRAARLLAGRGACRVLDVGAGVGKFCIIGALTTDIAFAGVEQRPHLVEIGRQAASALGAQKAGLFSGTLKDVSFRDYDAFYLFNPFAENLFSEALNIDRAVPLTVQRFFDDVAAMESALCEAEAGTLLCVYHRFGGAVPRAYELIHCEAMCTGHLRLWVKRRRERGR